MKTFSEMASEVESGKMAIPVWHEGLVTLFRNDQGKYVFSIAHSFFSAADTVDELEREILATINTDFYEEDSTSYAHAKARELVSLPVWQAVDTSLPAQFAKGVTLLSLRKELEAGEVVSPLLFTEETPYCIRKANDVKGFIEYTPTPYNDITHEYGTADEIYAHNLSAHFPIWMIGPSPAFLEVEEEFNRQQECELAEEKATPRRTIEVSEHEYRAIMADRAIKTGREWKEKQEERHVSEDIELDGVPF